MRTSPNTAEEALTKNQRKKMQKKRKSARETSEKLKVHMEKEKVEFDLMLNALEELNYDVGVDRVLDILQIIKKKMGNS